MRGRCLPPVGLVEIRMVSSPVGKHDEPQTPNDPSKDGASPHPNPTIPKAPDPGKHEQK